MPRLVDHHERKSALAHAVWTLVARNGLEAVSLRSVAAEAGVSMGRVQYYFATKDELLLHSLEYAHRQMEARISARLAEAGGDEREVLVTVLDELLGEHPEARDAIRVHAFFAARAADSERMAAVLTDGDDEILALAIRVVAQAKAAGRVAPDVDPDRDGYALWTLARGLGNDVALYGTPIDKARQTLTHCVNRVAPAA
ncbi:TetR/AcrR family transcriptional regulator [Nocardia australiensis]|uniref:TetR/AcrR family transcriptional regulator n=1 Tax=Nocardia australiensis TaxID=2887191 RepID=UPI001D153EF0|nr:TetR family transcriptional regulator [Nocardia australiensis]